MGETPELPIDDRRRPALQHPRHVPADAPARFPAFVLDLLGDDHHVDERETFGRRRRQLPRN